LKHENGTNFILQTEIEDNRRVHHMILFPDFSKVGEIREAFRGKCKDLDTDGRPKIWMSAEEIAEICIEAGCLIGFCHAFTPYFGLLALFDSYKDCYGSQWRNVLFLELGLSADTDMADRISELHGLTFLSNSDAHSPWPNKMGREFNKLRIREMGFSEVAKALRRENGRGCVLNAGFNPLEGKYHKTRCRGCLAFFGPENASRLGWRCPDCGKSIKKGVDYRIDELADMEPGKHPPHRPRYVHTIPLSEIISLTLNVQSAYSQKVQSLWRKFVDRFGSEIDVLLKEEITELAKVDGKVAEYIRHFRDDEIGYVPGGAGVYGKLLPPGKRAEIRTYKGRQRNLVDFGSKESSAS
ncbi:MAG: phosphotransferase, partial [Thermoplasmata archaeon]|nr:phosphotransferase [Thermoplasmata archaeon]